MFSVLFRTKKPAYTDKEARETALVALHGGREEIYFTIHELLDRISRYAHASSMADSVGNSVKAEAYQKATVKGRDRIHALVRAVETLRAEGLLPSPQDNPE